MASCAFPSPHIATHCNLNILHKHFGKWWHFVAYFPLIQVNSKYLARNTFLWDKRWVRHIARVGRLQVQLTLKVGVVWSGGRCAGI